MPYLCPVCRSPRKTELRDQISWRTHLKLGSLVAGATVVVFLFMGPFAAFHAVFAYLPLWAVAEFFHWVKMREAAKCQACGFDPILYRRDWRAARKKVEERLGKMQDELKAKAEQERNREREGRLAARPKPLDQVR